jgi:hypothetical protein
MGSGFSIKFFICSGVIIVRYPGTTERASGGTITTSGGYTYHTFTGSGTFLPT